MDIKPIETVYKDCRFRSKIEARWAVVFDTLGVSWIYEFQHYDFGVKAVWDDWEFKEYLTDCLNEAWDEDREDVIHDAYRHRYERRMYLPDFWLPEFNHWVEIKGKAPNWEEQTKARELARQSKKPVTILWGHIFPDPKKPEALWGDNSEIYGGDMNIIALFVVAYGVAAMDRAFAAARHARFEAQQHP